MNTELNQAPINHVSLDNLNRRIEDLTELSAKTEGRIEDWKSKIVELATGELTRAELTKLHSTANTQHKVSINKIHHLRSQYITLTGTRVVRNSEDRDVFFTRLDISWLEEDKEVVLLVNLKSCVKHLRTLVEVLVEVSVAIAEAFKNIDTKNYEAKKGAIR